MRRFRIGLAVAAVAFVLLARIWPEGHDRPAHAPDATIAASPASSPDEPDPTSVGRAPGIPITHPAPEIDPSAYRGPLGTRDHTGSDAVALTFDDGPDPDWTPRVLRELRKHHVKATFCLIGAYAEEYPELVAAIAADGHTLCNHSWFHEMDLGTWKRKDIRANLQRTNDAIHAAVPDADVPYFRQPGGKWTQRGIDVAAEMGMEALDWSVDPSDWDKDRTAKQIKQTALKYAEKGSIVLFHDGGANQKDTLAALRDVLGVFEDRGYRLVPL